MIAAVAAVVVGATTAYFSDTETSTGNTFTAGSLDLKIDSEQHYNGNVCKLNDQGSWIWVGNNPYPVPETPCDGSWAEADLGAHKFFNFSDLKPGDWGENTISLHVYNNDAWGNMQIKFSKNLDNTCTEPENSVDATCSDAEPMPGELLSNMTFKTWLDQGRIPGFQCGEVTPRIPRCPSDPWEGDNVWQDQPWIEQNPDEENPWSMPEPTIPTEMVAMDLSGGRVLDSAGNPVSPGDPDFDRASFFDVFVELDTALMGLTKGDEPVCLPTDDGHHDYGRCHGIAWDGRLVGSVTYYVGWAWHLPKEVGNNVQTDSVMGDMTFKVEQHRNNPSPTPTPTPTDL